VTPEAERWKIHFCESRINQDAAAQQPTCHVKDTTIKSQEHRQKENKQ
jgi:hypothetical protein